MCQSLPQLRQLNAMDVTLLMCGSMNPIHLYHLKALMAGRRYLLEECKCSSVRAIISPVGDAYGKVGLASAEHRLRMTRLAVEDCDLTDWVEVDDFECRSTDSWTPTLKVLKFHRERLDKKQRLVLLIASDVANTFIAYKPSGQPVWNPLDVREIIVEFGLLIINRFGHELSSKTQTWLEESPRFKENVAFVELKCTDHKLVSSTGIRERLKRGESIADLTTAHVIAYIREHKLYTTEGENERQ